MNRKWTRPGYEGQNKLEESRQFFQAVRGMSPLMIVRRLCIRLITKLWDILR